jgi:predicted RND superfamily exporter protein
MGGFAVLVFSVFPPNRQVGTLIVLNMATSAIGTLSILLVTIIALDKRGKFIRNTTAIRPTETIRQEDTTV